MVVVESDCDGIDNMLVRCSYTIAIIANIGKHGILTIITI